MGALSTWFDILEASASALADQIFGIEGLLAGVGLLVYVFGYGPLMKRLHAEIEHRWRAVPKKWPALAFGLWFVVVIMNTTHERIAGLEGELTAARSLGARTSVQRPQFSRFQIGESGIMFRNVVAGEWTPTPGTQGVPFDWSTVGDDADVFVEATINFGSDPVTNEIGPPGLGVRIRVLNLETGTVDGISEWILPNQNFSSARGDVGTRFQLSRGTGRSRYILEMTSDVEGWLANAGGFIGAEYRATP